MTIEFMNNPANQEKVELISFISDYHKDAYGFRPRNYNFQAWTMDELNSFVDELEVVVKQNIAETKKREQADDEAFKKLITDTIGYGAKDEQTALKWIAEAYKEDGELGYFEIESLLYNNGIMHTEYGKEIKAKLITIYGN